MSFLEKWVAVLTKPKETFAAEKQNASMGTAIGYLAISGLIVGIIFGLGISLLSAMYGGNDTSIVAFAALGLIGGPIFMVFGTIVGGLVSNIIYYVLAKLLGGKGTFTQQFYCSALYSAPTLIIMSFLLLIPLIGGLLSFLVGLYSLVLFYYSMKEVHEIDLWKIILVVVIIPILFLGLIFVMAVLWSSGIFNPSNDIESSGSYTRTACGGFETFGCMDQLVTSTSTTLVLTSELDRPIAVKGAQLQGLDAPLGCTIDNSLGPGSSQIKAYNQVYIECPGTNLKTGDPYNFAVTVTFVDLQSGLEKTETGGFFRGKVESA